MAAQAVANKWGTIPRIANSKRAGHAGTDALTIGRLHSAHGVMWTSSRLVCLRSYSPGPLIPIWARRELDRRRVVGLGRRLPAGRRQSTRGKLKHLTGGLLAVGTVPANVVGHCRRACVDLGVKTTATYKPGAEALYRGAWWADGWCFT